MDIDLKKEFTQGNLIYRCIYIYVILKMQLVTSLFITSPVC